MTTPLERLRAAKCQIELARAEISTAVPQARAAGASWADIANALGVTKQAAHKQYGPKPIPFDEIPLSDPLFDPLFLTPQVATAPDGTETTL